MNVFYDESNVVETKLHKMRFNKSLKALKEIKLNEIIIFS